LVNDIVNQFGPALGTVNRRVWHSLFHYHAGVANAIMQCALFRVKKRHE
jgi:hypothetical protein